MSANKKPRKAYRPRKVTADTLRLAIFGAAKPAPEERAEIMDKVSQAISRLSDGSASEHDWSVVSGALSVADEIEKRGIVRGVQDQIDRAAAAMQRIYDSAWSSGAWGCNPPGAEDIEAIQEFEAIHKFQIDQLSRGELLDVIDRAQRSIKKAGHTVAIEKAEA